MELITELSADHLERLSRGRTPLNALAELIWNSLDGDATEVEVTYARNKLGGMESIQVTDNGHGITHARGKETFGILGKSWKSTTRLSPGGRKLHGQKGEGRFGAFTLGTEAEWTTSANGEHGASQFTISGQKQKLGTFVLTDPVAAPSETTGTTLVITHIVADVDSALSAPDAPVRLAKSFALYLKQYPEAQLNVDGQRIDPSPFEVQCTDYRLSVPTGGDDEPIGAELTVVEWNQKFGRELVLCNDDGFPLAFEPGGIQSPGFEWSAYLRSDFIRKCDERNLLSTALSPTLEALLASARTRLRAHFRARSAELAKDVVSKWKEQEVYPYEGEPSDTIETVERQVFDVVALNLNEYLPSFEGSDTKSKKLSLRMLKTALERSPQEVQHLVQEVLDLPEDKREELSKLLEHTTLAAVISAARLVADRLSFLSGLEAVVFDVELKKHTKERAHLHRLIAENTWVFGEEFHLTVDDESLTQVLRKHKKVIGREEDEDLAPVSRLDGTTGIVDVMLSRSVPLPSGRGNEHLVVELKRPSKKLDSAVATQIQDYAFAVAADERFRDTNTRWVFWAVSNDMNDHVRRLSNQKDRPPGVIFEADDYCIWAKTWGQIIEDCRSRLRLFEQQLGYMANHDQGLEYLRETYEKYLPDAAKDRGDAE